MDTTENSNQDTVEQSNPESYSNPTLDSVTAENPVYSHIVGVFRERAQADQAMEALKQAGIGDEEPQLTEYNPHGAEGAVDSTQFESERRFLVHVLAVGKEQDAVEVLIRCGANNSDLPPGTALVRGSIINTNEPIADHAPTGPAVGASSDSLFEKSKPASHPSDVKLGDESTFKH